MESSASNASPAPVRFLSRVEEKSRDYRSGGSIVIVAFGDSVTMGATAAGTLEPEAVYHQRLKAMLEARYPGAVFSVINSGIGGDTATASLARLERDVLRYQPDLVLVAFGLNDAWAGKLPEFRDSLRQIVERIRLQSSADVILLTPSFMADRQPPRVDAAFASMLPRVTQLQKEGGLAQFAAAVREVATSHALPLADVFAAWTELARAGVDTTAMLANGINHPSGDAHAIAAGCVMQAILPEVTVKGLK